MQDIFNIKKFKSYKGIMGGGISYQAPQHIFPISNYQNVQRENKYFITAHACYVIKNMPNEVFQVKLP